MRPWCARTGWRNSTDRRVKRAIDERYRATIVAHWRSAALFPISTFFYAIAVSVIVALGAFYGPEWGLTFGRVLRVHLPVRRLPPRVHGPARDLRRHADRDRRLAEDPDGARPADRDRRARPRRRVAGGTDPGPHDRAGLFVPRGGAGPARHLGRGRTRHARRDRRPDRRREDDVREAPGPARRSRVGAHPGGRGGSARRVADIATERHPHGSAGRVPVRHDGARERAVRQTRRRATGTSRPRSTSWASPTGSRRCRRAWTLRSASEAKRCPSASASSCRSPGRRSTSPGC